MTHMSRPSIEGLPLLIHYGGRAPLVRGSGFESVFTLRVSANLRKYTEKKSGQKVLISPELLLLLLFGGGIDNS